MVAVGRIDDARFRADHGAGIPASSSCSVSVNVTDTTAGPHVNVSGFISSTESGTNTGTGGSAAATLTAILPPVIVKSFGTDPILQAGPRC